MTRHVKRIGALAGCALLLVSCSSKPPKSLVTPLPTVSKPTQQANEPMRGIWLATVSRLDWPPVASVNGTSADQRIAMQKQALIAKLDNLKHLGINTVFFRKAGQHGTLVIKNITVVRYADGQHRRISGIRSASVYAG